MQETNYAIDSITKTTEKVKFKCHIDHWNREKEKPKEQEKIKNINGALNRLPMQVTLSELVNYIVQGCSFVPASYTDRRKEENFNSMQLFTIDIDDNSPSLEDIQRQCRNNNLSPCLIYPSFSYTEEKRKYRVAFLSPIEYTDPNKVKHIIGKLIAIFGGDEKCKDTVRLFFGTNRSLCNDDNFYCDDEVFQDFSPMLTDYDPQTHAEPLKQAKKIKGKYNITKIKKVATTQDNKHIEAIRNKDIHTLQQLLKDVQLDSEIYNNKELVKAFEVTEQGLIIRNEYLIANILSYYPLNEILDIKEYRSFCCLFHEDTSPSASIYKGKGDGKYLYKCNGRCNHTMHLVNIISAISGLPYGETITFLCKILNIEVKESEWLTNNKRAIKYLIDELESPRLKELYPQYKYLRSRITHFIRFLNDCYIRINEAMQDSNGNPMFSGSYQKFTKIFDTTNRNSVAQNLAMLTLMGFSFKTPNEDIPPHILNKAYKHFDNRITMMSFNSNINEFTLREGEERLKLLTDNLINMRAITRHSIASNFGEDMADLIYPQCKGFEVTTDRKEILTEQLVSRILQDIKEKGYSVEKQLITMYTYHQVNINTGEILKNYRKPEIEHQLKQRIGAIANEQGLKRVKVNKDNRALYNIDETINTNTNILVKAL